MTDRKVLIVARTGAEKRDLAARLAEGNPAVLDDLKRIARVFGPLLSVEIELNDTELPGVKNS